MVFYLDPGLQRCQQLFADLNRYAIRPTRSLSLLYDHRDEHAQLVKLVILKSARIMGDVFYDALTIEQGAQVEGRFAHRDTKAKASAAPQGGTKPELTVAG